MSLRVLYSTMSLKKFYILIGMIHAYDVKTPKDFNAASCSYGVDVSFKRVGMSGRNTLLTMGSIPMDLLKEDLAIREITFTRSVRMSGTLSSGAFMKVLSIEISRVGRELLFVMSRFVSSDLPLMIMFCRTLKAAAREFFFSWLFRSDGVS
jgi:hypothetical protein